MHWVVIAWLLFAVTVSCRNIHVPAAYPDISTAISNARSGDSIYLDQSLFSGPGNCDIIVRDLRDILIISSSASAVVDCGFRSRCLSILSCQNVSISGVTFRNGAAPSNQVLLMNHVDISLRREKLLPRRRSNRERQGYLVATFFMMVNTKGQVYVKVKKRKSNFRSSSSNSVFYDANTIYHDDIGGCVLVVDSSSVVFSGVSMLSCSAIKGSGLGVQRSKDVSVTFSRFSGNGFTLSNAALSYANSTLLGGGAFFANCTGIVSIDNSEFSDNFLVSSGAGDVKGGGLYVSNSSLVMDQLIVQNNSITALSYQTYLFGGGICCVNVFDIKASNLYLVGNSVVGTVVLGWMGGGAIYSYYISNSYLLSNVIALNNSLIIRQTGFAAGSGIYTEQSSNLQFSSLNVNNNVISGSSGGGVQFLFCGAAMYFSNCHYASISGFSTINNTIFSQSRTGAVQGGAVFVDTCDNFQFLAGVVKGNTVTATSIASVAQGAGVYFQSSTLVTIQSVSIANNVGLCLFSAPVKSFSPLPTITSDARHCQTTSNLAFTDGSITDGSIGKYSPRMLCSWTVTTPVAGDGAFNIFNLSFVNLDVEPEPTCSYDSVSIFDGSSSYSPLLGKYCGNLPSAAVCAGKCPSFQSIFTTGAAFTVIFYSDYSEQYDGFYLNYTLIAAGNRTGSAGRIDNIDTTGSIIGGGIYAVNSGVIVQTSVISHNLIVHSNRGFGGGIAAHLESTISVVDSVLEGNVALAGTVAGGGLLLSMGAAASIKNSVLSKNLVLATGNCFWLVDGSVRCPSSWGGAVAAISSILTVASSNFNNNSAGCQMARSCLVQGGGFVLLSSGSLEFNSSVCQNNGLDCRASQGCLKGSGGCGYGNQGFLLVDEFSLVKGNSAGDVGGGGGLCAAEMVQMFIQGGSILDGNLGREGGGLRITDSAIVNIQDSKLVGNLGVSGAGGIAVIDDASLYMTRCSLVSNSALRATVILGYNDNDLGDRVFKDVNVFGSKGNFALMLGRLEAGGVNWGCQNPGSVFNNDSTSGFFSLSCIVCDAGSYSVLSATSSKNNVCRLCVYGANCRGGSWNSSGLLALPGFWGNVDNNTAEVTFTQCPFGYCCPSTNTNGCEFDFCAGGRVGRLCGGCPSGQGFRFFSDSCGLDSECKDAGWAGLALILLSVVATVLLLVTSKSDSIGYPSVIIFFYQAFPLVKPTPWKYGATLLVSVLQSIFQITPLAGGDGSKGVCLFKGMTASQKMGVKMWFQVIVLFTFALLYLMQTVLHKKFPRYFGNYPPKWPQYLCGIVQFLTVAYVVLTLTPLQMLQCVFINDQHVWWWDANVTCYTSWQISAGIFLFTILSPVPLVMIVFLARWKDASKLSEWKREVRRTLASEYKDSRLWWAGYSLYRLLLLVIAYATISDGNWQSITTTSLCSLFLICHLLAKPFKSCAVRRAETLCLTILGVLSATAAPQLSRVQFGAALGLSNEEHLERFQICLVVAPIAVVLLIILKKVATFAYIVGFKKGSHRIKDFTAAVMPKEEEGEANREEGTWVHKMVCTECAEGNCDHLVLC